MPGVPSRPEAGDEAQPQDRIAREQLAAEPKVGNKIGAYRLVSLLGKGSTGRVFEVEHERIGRRAAMKTLAAEHAVRSDAIKRLFAEALAVNKISNPHIVEVTDVVEEGVHRVITDGEESVSPVRVNALVMEILEGQSLGHLMKAEGPLPPERFLAILAQVCEALAAAHAAGFVHRDLKPENIFLIERDGQADFVKLLDFGLAKIVKTEPGVRRNPSLQTLDGTFLGTPAYASPEQASGKQIGHQTDIYSLGVVLYELVAGRLPFEGNSIADFILQHLNATAPPLPDDVLSTRLGRTLDAVINRCLEKAPAGRFLAEELAQILWALSRGEAVRFTVRENYQVPATVKRRGRQPALSQIAWGVGIGLVVALGAAGVAGRLWQRPSRPNAIPALASQPAPEGSTPGARPGSPAALPAIISFESEPAGAEVRIAGTTEALGTTPFKHAFPGPAQPVEVELRLPGHETARVTFSPATSQSISMSLTRTSAGAARRQKSGPGPASGPVELEKEATIDPFR